MANGPSKTFLVTGGIGFIGSWYCDELLAQNPDHRVICVDKLTYCTSPHTVNYLTSKYGESGSAERNGASRFELIVGDICDPGFCKKLKTKLQDTEYELIHFAAESLVDNSFLDPQLVISTNVNGTLNLLELARTTTIKRFVHMSTDEVYGEQTDCIEAVTTLKPTTPYAASKASSELLVNAYATTWKLPVQIIRCSNVFGPRQYPEKIVPIVCANLVQTPCIPSTVHGTGLNKRRYLYVTDAIKAIETIRASGELGGIYNIGTDEENELSNIDLVKLLICLAGHQQDQNQLINYGQDRLYNDAQYSMNCDKITKLGWKPTVGLEEGMMLCLQWTRDNPHWFK